MYTLRSCTGQPGQLQSAFQRRLKTTTSLRVRFRPLSPSAPVRTVDAEAEGTIRRSLIDAEDEEQFNSVTTAESVDVDEGQVAPEGDLAWAQDVQEQSAEAELEVQMQNMSSEVCASYQMLSFNLIFANLCACTAVSWMERRAELNRSRCNAFPYQACCFAPIVCPAATIGCAAFSAVLAQATSMVADQPVYDV